jgi:hypothetical protein
MQNQRDAIQLSLGGCGDCLLGIDVKRGSNHRYTSPAKSA